MRAIAGAILERILRSFLDRRRTPETRNGNLLRTQQQVTQFMPYREIHPGLPLVPVVHHGEIAAAKRIIRLPLDGDSLRSAIEELCNQLLVKVGGEVSVLCRDAMHISIAFDYLHSYPEFVRNNSPQRLQRVNRDGRGADDGFHLPERVTPNRSECVHASASPGPGPTAGPYGHPRASPSGSSSTKRRWSA